MFAAVPAALGSARRYAALLLLASPLAAAEPAQDVARGAAIYAQRCAFCHSLDRNGVGPRHRGVFGRRAGSVPGYAYSPALKHSELVWNEKNLNLWLQDPDRLVPGSKMDADVTDPTRRALLISYLKAVSAHN
jgi:cytochrome c